MDRIRVGNGAGFWGDSPAAPRSLLQDGDLDYLTLEYLAELTLSILAHQKRKNPAAGFVTDVPQVAGDLAEIIKRGAATRSDHQRRRNESKGLRREVAKTLLEHNLDDLRIGVAAGDDFHGRIGQLQEAGEALENMDNRRTV